MKCETLDIKWHVFCSLWLIVLNCKNYNMSDTVLVVYTRLLVITTACRPSKDQGPLDFPFSLSTGSRVSSTTTWTWRPTSRTLKFWTLDLLEQENGLPLQHPSGILIGYLKFKTQLEIDFWAESAEIVSHIIWMAPYDQFLNLFSGRNVPVDWATGLTNIWLLFADWIRIAVVWLSVRDWHQEVVHPFRCCPSLRTLHLRRFKLIRPGHQTHFKGLARP